MYEFIHDHLSKHYVNNMYSLYRVEFNFVVFIILMGLKHFIQITKIN